MKLFSNLPGNLRALFGIARVLTMISAVFWLLTITFNTWVQHRVGHSTGLMNTVGDVIIPTVPGSVALRSDNAEPGSLKLESLRGTLRVDLASEDAALVSAVRWSLLPSMAVSILFSYVLFTALRDVCANLERGVVFSESNLRLIQRIGASLIAYSLVGAGLELWTSYVFEDYFSQHVVLTGIPTSLPFPGGGGALGFLERPSDTLSMLGGLVTGCLVLLVAGAFRQGLKLKTESDLTV